MLLLKSVSDLNYSNLAVDIWITRAGRMQNITTHDI